MIRQARFLGLREDKPAESVTLEAASSNVGSGENPRPDQPESTGDAVIGGVRLSHPDKPLYPQQGITKRALAGYLEAVAARMLPHLENRLLSVVRCPQGTQETCFFQRHRDAGLGAYLRSLDVEKSSGGSREYLYLASKTELISAAQLGILEFHVWGSRIDAVERPDRLVFDLDPDPSVGFEEVKTAAVLMRDSLDALGLRSFPLVTGGKGVHVVAPLTRRHEWPVVKAFAKALAERVVEDDPERYVATMSKAKRKGRIFIDHFRNGRSATAIAPYSPRAREGAPLAWPVSWNELQKLDAAHRFRLGDVDLDAADPWADYPHLRQNLKAASLRAMGISET
ncbi:MAG TPA: non-homologous end-joining DNA ligase [Alphaproteobacteria bacterium]|nr:non-homologous end-joining DNA ligase [Alphaproteobacteria bacterium]